MPKLFTTFMPEVELDVSDHEAEQLDAMGVVVKTTATTEEGRRKAAENQTGKTNDQKSES